MRYKLKGKTSTIRNVLVQEFKFKNKLYAAVLSSDPSTINCDIFDTDNGIVYINSAIRVFDKSSLIRCIQAFSCM